MKKKVYSHSKSIHLDAIHTLEISKKQKKPIIFGEIYDDECDELEIQFMLI